MTRHAPGGFTFEQVSAESPAAPAAPRAAVTLARPPSAALGPPRTKRRRPRLWAALDYVIAALFAVVIFGVMLNGAGINRFPVWFPRGWLVALLAVCLAAPAALRRRGPLRALAAVLVACVVTM